MTEAMKSPLVSIIVPVYNQEKYLSRCIDSLLAQTYSNIEILLIDDGSTDKTPQICDEYAEYTNKVKLFHTENRGQSAARNFALDLAQGLYIACVDSDDWIESDMIERLVETAHRTSSEMIFFNQKIDYSVINKDLAIEKLFKGELKSFMCFIFCHCKLWQNIRLPLNRLVEDSAIMHLLISNANNVCITEKKYYHYFHDNPTNSTNSEFNKAKMQFGLALMWIDRYEWYNNKAQVKKDITEILLVNAVMGCICSFRIFKKYPYQLEHFFRAKSFLRKNICVILRSSALTIKRKIVAILGCCSANIVRLLP